MQLTKNKVKQRKAPLEAIGILILILCAAGLLWFGKANSNQAISAVAAQVYFEGDYRIGDGPWQQIVSGQHIPATKGDVTLRGNFHILTPDGEYVGIYDGDILFAEKTPSARNGDIVVALVEDEATVKTFYKENGHFRLQPENDAFDPIIVDELIILGKVVAMMRYF